MKKILQLYDEACSYMDSCGVFTAPLKSKFCDDLQMFGGWAKFLCESVPYCDTRNGQFLNGGRPPSTAYVLTAMLYMARLDFVAKERRFVFEDPEENLRFIIKKGGRLTVEKISPDTER